MFNPSTAQRLVTSSIRASRLPAATTSLRINNTYNNIPASRPFSASTVAMSQTVIEAIKADHREIEECYDNIINAQDDDTRERWQNKFVWEVARHSLAEELVVYPAIEKHLGPSGKEIADKDRAEHQVVKNGLAKFQNMKVNHPDLIPTLKGIMDELAQHIKEEEEHDMVKLEQALSTDDSISMAKSFSRTKAFVPSRSHPHAPNKPPFETAIGLMTAPIDHIRDLFRKFPDESISPNPSTK